MQLCLGCMDNSCQYLLSRYPFISIDKADKYIEEKLTSMNVI